jgi:hypothetical protein
VSKLTLLVVCAGLSLALAGDFLGLVPDAVPRELSRDFRVVGQNRNGVLVVGSEAQPQLLAAVSGRVLAADLKEREFYRVRLIEPASRADLAAVSRILDADGQEYVVEVAVGAVEHLMKLPAELARINLRGWVFADAAPQLPPVFSNPVIEQLVARVSPDSVLAAVRRLQNYRNRYSTGDSCRAASEWIKGRFEAYGCDAVVLENHTSGHAPNVIGIKYGTAGQRNPYAIIDGHFDSYAATNAPGADDNASGTVAAIEAARVTQGFQFTNDLRFIAFSGEEFGLYGSDYYATEARNRGDSILGVLNFDMIGYEDPAPEDLDLVTKISDPPCGPFAAWFTAVADTYTTLACSTQMVSDNQNSDHGPFWNNGYLAFCGIEDFWPGNPHYHTSHDSIGAGYNSNSFCTEVIRAGVAALATLGEPVPLNQPLVGIRSTRIDDAAGNNNGFWDAGESVAVYVTLKNFGTVAATSVSATVSTTDPYVTLYNTAAAYGTISGGDTALPSTPFTMTAAPGTPREHIADFTVTITATESTWQPHLALQIGEYLVTDPVPDGPRQPALYWAYDNVDVGYPPHPTYAWVEIRSQGTRLSYPQNDDVALVSLPTGFGPVRFYGQRYTQISVSADGWIALGDYPTSNYSNTGLPSSAAPPAAVFANWDDLYPEYSGSGYVYWYHDAANHRLIVEYDSVAYYNPTSVRDKFQVIFYDTTLASVDGSSVVVVQYQTANRTASATTGIQNQAQTIGIQCLYNGSYAHGAAPVTAGSAIKYSTDAPTGVVEQPARPSRARPFVTLTPNPARSATGFRLTLGPHDPTAALGLYDAAGRRLRTFDTRGSAFAVTGLAPGVYFARLTAAGTTTAVKVVVTR